jgi:hypothetical protein
MARDAVSARREDGHRRRPARPLPGIRGESYTPAYDLWTLSRFAAGVSRLRGRRRALARSVVLAMFVVPLAVLIVVGILSHL